MKGGREVLKKGGLPSIAEVPSERSKKSPSWSVRRHGLICESGGPDKGKSCLGLREPERGFQKGWRTEQTISSFRYGRGS